MCAHFADTVRACQAQRVVSDDASKKPTIADVLLPTELHRVGSRRIADRVRPIHTRMVVDDAFPYTMVLVQHRVGGAVESRVAIHALDERVACRKACSSNGLLRFIAETIQRRGISRMVRNSIFHLRERRSERSGIGARVEARLQVGSH